VSHLLTAPKTVRNPVGLGDRGSRPAKFVTAACGRS